MKRFTICQLSFNMDIKLAFCFVLILYFYNKATLAWISDESLKTDVTCAYTGLGLDCGSDKVIVLHSAEYGYSPGNKCNVSHEKYPRGCSNDVMGIFDEVCTGMATCQYPGGKANQIPSAPMLKLNKNCRGLADIYLTVKYSCEKDALKNGCRVQHTPKGVISSRTPSCLNKSIMLLAPEGQMIVLYLRVIGPLSEEEYLTIKDGTNVVPVHVTETGIHEVYQSKDNQLELLFGTKPFVIQYEFINVCDTYEPADDTHVVVSYNASKTVVVCTNNRQVQWMLTCVDGQWEGTQQQCHHTDDQNNNVLVIGIAAAVTAVVVVIVIAVACVITKQNRQQTQATNQNVTSRSNSYEPTTPKVHFHLASSDDPYALQTQYRHDINAPVYYRGDPPSYDAEQPGLMDPSSLPPPRQSMLHDIYAQPDKRMSDMSDLSLPPLPEYPKPED